MDGIQEDYGIDDWWMKGTTVRLRDKAGDEWLISPHGVPQCLGGGVVADEPEPEEEEFLPG